MGKINWRVIDDEGNPQGYYIQTVPEVDICNHTFNQQGGTYVSAIDGKYGNLLISATESDDTPGANPSYATNLAPTIHTWDGDNDNAVNFMSERPLEPYFKRFQNPRDNNQVESTYISYDKLWDIYENDYPQDNYKRFICSTQGYSIWIDDVTIESTFQFYEEDQQQHTYNNLKVILRMDDGEGTTVSYYSLASGYDIAWGSAIPLNCGILVTLVMIHNFYPKYWEDQRTGGYNNNCYMYKTGYIATSPTERSQEPSEPLTVPVCIRVPEKWAAQTYAAGSYQYGIVHIADEWNFRDLVKQWLFVEDNGLCSIPPTSFKFGGTGNIVFGDGVYSSTGLISGTQYISNLSIQPSRTGLYDMVKIPIKHERIDEQDAIVYLTMSYTYNEDEKYPEPSADIPTDTPGYNEGGTFTGYDNIGTDKTDGFNNWTLQAMNANHTCNFSNYVGTESVIRELIDDIFSLTDNGAKKLLALSSSWEPADVICRILELPFSNTWLFDASSFADAAPAIGDKVLTWQKMSFSTQSEYDEYMAFANGMTLDEWENSRPSIFTGISSFGEIPKIGDNLYIKYYKRAVQRFFNIPYGEKVIKRIYGDSDDFTDTKYILTLPGGESVELSPSQMFRNVDSGVSAKECTLKIDGIMDIDTGDVLINITANNNVILQTTINVAIERTAGEQSDTNQLRAIASTIGQLVGSIGTIALGSVLPSNSTVQFETGNRDAILHNVDQGRGIETNEKTQLSANRTMRRDYYSHPATGAIGNTLKAVTNEDMFVKTQEVIGTGNVSGSVKIIGNQLPYLDIYYPIRQIPEGWKESRGYTTVSGVAGQGYNRYSVVDYIIPNQSNMLEPEKNALIDILKGGYYLNGNS